MTATFFQEHFEQRLGPYWQRLERGTGRLNERGQTLRLVNEPAVEGRYSNAQIDDYQNLPRRQFLWRPPVSLTVTARFSHPDIQDAIQDAEETQPLLGTAGFGFWNDPFLRIPRPERAGRGLRPPALPRSIWFFYASPPSDMRLAQGVPGAGWKAATVDTSRWSFLALLPALPLGIPLMWLRPLRRRLWPIVQQQMNVSEQLVPVSMTSWHTYTIEWRKRTARFTVDGDCVMECNTAPRGPLGLVIWKDTQYMQVTPSGRIRHGTIGTDCRQWLELAYVEVADLS